MLGLDSFTFGPLGPLGAAIELLPRLAQDVLGFPASVFLDRRGVARRFDQGLGHELLLRPVMSKVALQPSDLLAQRGAFALELHLFRGDFSEERPGRSTIIAAQAPGQTPIKFTSESCVEAG